MLLVGAAGLTTPEVEALSDVLKALRRHRDLAAEFVIVNSTSGEFVPRVPSVWTP